MVKHRHNGHGGSLHTYLGQTKPNLPVSYQDIYDGNAKSQQTGGLQAVIQAKYDNVKATKASADAAAGLNGMMDKQAFAMHNAQKAIDDKAASDKAAAKAQRELLNGAQPLLVLVVIAVSAQARIWISVHRVVVVD